MTTVYMDTSALAKWYLNEARSEDVEAYLRQVGPVAVSSLTLLEMRSLLARRVREGSLNSSVGGRVWAVVEQDVTDGFLRRYPLEDGHLAAATGVFDLVSQTPLRSLDTLHLAVARAIGTQVLATADRVMAAAALSLGLEVVRFD